MSMSRRGLFAALSVLVAGLFAVLAIPAADAGPRPAGSIKGIVYDARHHAVAGARVALHDSNGRAIAGTSSTRGGEFRFANVAPGHYIVVATYAGTNTRLLQGRAAVDVRAGQISHVRIIVQ